MTRNQLGIGAAMLALGIGAASAQQTMQDFDTDADSMISEEEFTSANPSFATTSFSELDQNDDGMVTQDDWIESPVSEAVPFEEYDFDESGDISEEEFAQGEFGRFDADEDGFLDETEFGAYAEEAEAQESD